MRLWVGALAALCLAGCNGQTNDNPEAAPIWFRTDCQKMVGNPELTRKFQIAVDICANKATAAGEASIANIPTGPNMGTAVAAGIQAAQTKNAVAVPTALACMGEQGYMRKPLVEARQFCPAVGPAMAATDAKSPAQP